MPDVERFDRSRAASFWAMLARGAAVVSGILLVMSGLMPWTRDGLSGAYVAGGLGGLFVLAGLVVAGVGLVDVAESNESHRETLFVEIQTGAGLAVDGGRTGWERP